MIQEWYGGNYIFSDSPESPSAPGRLYDDPEVPATLKNFTNRIFAYHVNANTEEAMRYAPPFPTLALWHLFFLFLFLYFVTVNQRQVLIFLRNCPENCSHNRGKSAVLTENRRI
jgi:hypothetical protein